MSPQISPADTEFLAKTLELAQRGRRFVSPNPMVGAVVVREGEIVGTGFHRQFGGDHAEVEALREAGHLARGATLYCNLEPCSHFGKTPPCAPRVIDAGIARVVIGTTDPNPLVNGRGVQALQEQGIAVVSGVLEAECRELNECFFKFVTARLPFVTLKIAQSLDGRIADRAGYSRWISNETARQLSHRWRWQSDAVMIGIGTVLADDPSLTPRLEEGPQPRRIVLDTHLRIPLTAKLLKDAQVEQTIVITSTTCPERNKMQELERRGAKVWQVETTASGSLAMLRVLERAAQEGIADLLVEGGRRISTTLIEERLADRLAVFLAPVLLGEGIPAFQGLRIDCLGEAVRLENPRWRILGDNALVTGRLKYAPGPC